MAREWRKREVLSSLGTLRGLVYIADRTCKVTRGKTTSVGCTGASASGVYRRAFAMLRDEQEAQDVTQDTFLAYMRGESSLRGEASPFTVLYQIATYKAVDRLRRNSRWSGTLGSLDVPRMRRRRARPLGQLADEGGLGRVEAARDLTLLTEGEKRRRRSPPRFSTSSKATP